MAATPDFADGFKERLATADLLGKLDQWKDLHEDVRDSFLEFLTTVINTNPDELDELARYECPTGSFNTDWG